jgi:hypothetical protein
MLGRRIKRSAGGLSKSILGAVMLLGAWAILNLIAAGSTREPHWVLPELQLEPSLISWYGFVDLF